VIYPCSVNTFIANQGTQGKLHTPLIITHTVASSING